MKLISYVPLVIQKRNFYDASLNWNGVKLNARHYITANQVSGFRPTHSVKCGWQITYIGNILGGWFKTQISRTHSRPIESESLGIGLGMSILDKIPGNFLGIQKFEHHCLEFCFICVFLVHLQVLLSEPKEWF